MKLSWMPKWKLRCAIRKTCIVLCVVFQVLYFDYHLKMKIAFGATSCRFVIENMFFLTDALVLHWSLVTISGSCTCRCKIIVMWMPTSRDLSRHVLLLGASQYSCPESTKVSIKLWLCFFESLGGLKKGLYTDFIGFRV